MFKLKFSAIALTALIALCFATSRNAAAQSTVFNTPSTDVAARGSYYVEADFIGHFGKYDKGGFQTYGVRGVYGVRRNLEVGANVFFTRAGSATPTEIQPNVKWQAYSNEKHQIGVSGGAMLFVPLNRQAGTRPVGMIYANASKKIGSLNGLRVTGGAYAFVGAKRESGTKTGVTLAYEQPLFKRVNFLADWFSGKNRVGYAAAGFGVAITKRQNLYAGYNFGNAGRGNNSLAVFYGISF